MSEVAHSSEPIDGVVVTPSIADRTVAFFVALNDDKVDKGWSDFGKSMLVLGPAVAGLMVTRGKGKKKLKGLIAPAIALGKLVADVNRQVTPEHLNQAHDLVEQAKFQADQLKATAFAAAKTRTRR